MMTDCLSRSDTSRKMKNDDAFLATESKVVGVLKQLEQNSQTLSGQHDLTLLTPDPRNTILLCDVIFLQNLLFFSFFFRSGA